MSLQPSRSEPRSIERHVRERRMSERKPQREFVITRIDKSNLMERQQSYDTFSIPHKKSSITSITVEINLSDCSNQNPQSQELTRQPALACEKYIQSGRFSINRQQKNTSESINQNYNISIPTSETADLLGLYSQPSKSEKPKESQDTLVDDLISF